jgi:DNA replication protein DnaC
VARHERSFGRYEQVLDLEHYAEQAIKEQRSHIGYLEALLAMESEERDRHAIQQRLRDAKLPRVKTLEEFDFNQARQIPAAKIRQLAEGGYIERAEPVVLMGECGTGKTRIWRRACAWPRADRSEGRDSPRPRTWSMNWSKPGNRMR